MTKHFATFHHTNGSIYETAEILAFASKLDMEIYFKNTVSETTKVSFELGFFNPVWKGLRKDKLISPEEKLAEDEKHERFGNFDEAVWGERKDTPFEPFEEDDLIISDHPVYEDYVTLTPKHPVHVAVLVNMLAIDIKNIPNTCVFDF